MQAKLTYREALNESPYEKVGKWVLLGFRQLCPFALNESPYEKVGKYRAGGVRAIVAVPQ